MCHCPSPSEFVSTHGSLEVGKTHVDVELRLLGRMSVTQSPHLFRLIRRTSHSLTLTFAKLLVLRFHFGLAEIPLFPSISTPAVLLALLFPSPFPKPSFCFVLLTKRAFGVESTSPSSLHLLHIVGSLIPALTHRWPSNE